MCSDHVKRSNVQCIVAFSFFSLPFFLFRSNVQGDSQTSICITIEPGLLLKGDILVRDNRQRTICVSFYLAQCFPKNRRKINGFNVLS